MCYYSSMSDRLRSQPLDIKRHSRDVVIVQDDWIFAGDDKKILSGLGDINVVTIGTGMEFLECFGALKSHPPLLLIGDVRLKGLFPDRGMPERFPEIIEEGSQDRPNTVGLRCMIMFAQDPATRDVPLAISTIFSDIELRDLPSGLSVPESATYLSRRSDDYENKLRRLVSANS